MMLPGNHGDDTPPLGEEKVSISPDHPFVQLQRALPRPDWREKIRDSHARNRLNALPPPGQAPFGYKRGKERYVIDRSAAAIVRDFFDQFLLYGSLRGAVRYLSQYYGKTISTSTAQRWLSHPVYRGDLRYQNGEEVRNTHTPILSRDEAAQIDRLLRRNRRLPPRTAGAQRSLAGLVHCTQCGSKTSVTSVTRRGKQQRYLYLRPTHCPQKESGQKGCPALNYDRFLDEVILEICQSLPTAVESLAAHPNLNPKVALQNTLEQKQHILEQLPDLYAQQILDQSTWEDRTRTLRQEIAALRTQLEQLPPVNLKELVQAVAIPQFWQDLSESERRFFFREFIRSIAFDPQTHRIQLNFVFQPPSLSQDGT